MGDARQGDTGDGIRGTVRGTAPVPLSVLDLATVGSGFTATDALRTSVEIARLAETRGYHRMWVAEHHSMPGGRQFLARGDPRPPRRAHRHAAARLRRGDAAQPRAAGDRRAVRHPGGARARPDRPRTRPRAGHRRGDRRRAAPHRVAARGRRRLPAAARRADRLPGRRLPRRAPLRPYPRHPRPGAGQRGRRRAVRGPAEHLAARLVRLQRPTGRRARPAVLLRAPLRGRQHRAGAGALPRVLPPVGGAGPALRLHRRLRAGRRRPGARPAARCSPAR